MNYETATDFELNKILTKYQTVKVISEDKIEVKGVGVRSIDYPVSYCNNWNDIMPIAVELGVCLSPVDPKSHHEAIVFDKNGYIKMSIYDKSPQRALVICCIKVLEKDNV